MLLFVAYQLWGTGLRTAQAQSRLDRDLRAQLDAATPTPKATDRLAETTAEVRSLRAEASPVAGQPIGRIEAASIGLDWVFVEGVSVADLKKGPGHYSETPMPGQSGNVALAGHRTTYGAPFNRIDELAVGDEIVVTTIQGRFRYRVAEKFVVDPSQVEVLQPVPGRNTLTLTSCHPKYSARQRLIVRGDLSGEPSADSSAQMSGRQPSSASLSLSGETVSRSQPLLWGAAVGAISLIAWRGGRMWRRWPAYGIGVGPFFVALFFFFETVSRLLPSDF